MNNLKLYSVCILTLLLSILSCSDDILIDRTDDKSYLAINESYGYLNSTQNTLTTQELELRDNELVSEVYIGLTKEYEKDVNLSLEISEVYLDAYNKAHGAVFELFPKENVKFDKDGVLTISKGELKSNNLNITFLKTNLEEKTYLLPLVVKDNSEIKFSNESKVLYFLIRVAGEIPSTAKESGVVSICYVEVNSNNILNVGSYTLKNSGKQLFDIVMIFAANINYDPEKDKAILYFNPNVEKLLANKDKYIKPLQDKGIKVVLSVLGNHHPIGFANLNQIGIIDFAAQCKAAVDAYGLDGVDFDDEWAKYGTNPNLPPVNEFSYGRLLIELRRIMPNKLITVYDIGYTYYLGNTIDGVDVGTIVNYSYNPFYGSWTGVSNLKGLTNKQWGPAPIAFHGTSGNQSYPSPYDPSYHSTRIIDEGYGVNLCYDMRNIDYSKYLTKLSLILYGEETVLSGKLYKKEEW